MQYLRTLDTLSMAREGYVDELDDLADAMGDDFGFGFDDEEGDPNIKPVVAKPPEEKELERTSTSCTFTWPPMRQTLTNLYLQAAPYNAGKKKTGFADFDLTSKGGGKQQKINDPATSTGTILPELEPSTQYQFRLVCINPAGESVGEATAPIETLGTYPRTNELYLLGKIYCYLCRCHHDTVARD